MWLILSRDADIYAKFFKYQISFYISKADHEEIFVTDGSPELIALFQTRLEPMLELLPW